MYVVLAILFGVVFWAGTILGQRSTRPVDDQEDLIEKRMKMREEMHRRMIDKLLHGIGPDQDMFSDMEKMMDDIMSDSMSGLSLTNSASINFSTDWQETKSGRTLAITPKDPGQNLDINVSNGFVTIKGKNERKTQNGVSYSNFSNSFNVPADCDDTKVKMEQKDGKILLHFPFRTARASTPEQKKEPERKPLPPSENDVQI